MYNFAIKLCLLISSRLPNFHSSILKFPTNIPRNNLSQDFFKIVSITFKQVSTRKKYMPEGVGLSLGTCMGGRNRLLTIFEKSQSFSLSYPCVEHSSLGRRQIYQDPGTTTDRLIVYRACSESWIHTCRTLLSLGTGIPGATASTSPYGKHSYVKGFRCGHILTKFIIVEGN